MQPMSREDDDKQTYAYARKLESDFTSKYHELDKRVSKVEDEIDGLASKLLDICKQLKHTEGSMSAKLDILIIDKARREGETKERNRWPEYASLFVSVGTLIGMLYVAFELISK